MEVIQYDEEKNLAIIKKGITITTTQITPKIREIIENNKKQEKKQKNTKKSKKNKEKGE